jgi:NitT/TauT family transport system ATP-binding protein
MAVKENGNGKVEFEDTPLPNIIQLKNVSHTFDGKNNVINDFNLLIEDYPDRGQFVVILGVSGCGKSTILNFIAGLLKPTSGEILVNDKPISCCYPMVFQRYSNLYWRTVLENVMLPLEIKGEITKEGRDKAKAMLEMVGLQDHMDKYASDQVLSGGQLQRIAIARALMEDPCIILMDEPFGALDIHTRTKMQLLLKSIWEPRNITIIFVTHDIQEAVFLGDDIFIMDSNPGRIVEHYKVDLPLHREREIRRDPKFTRLVGELEDSLFALNNKMKQ